MNVKRWSTGYNLYRFLILLMFLITSIHSFAHTTKISIGVIPGALKYDVVQFDVHAGSPVELNFSNNGLMPHNLVMGSKSNTRDAIVQAAMAIPNGYAQQFVPKSDLVLVASKLLQVNESQTIKFTAPKENGNYPYLCTFPGHGVIMRGVMRVRKSDEKLSPPITLKQSGAKLADNLAESNVTPFPIGSESRPLVMRTFVPNLGFDQMVLPNHSRGYPSPRYDPSKGSDVKGTYSTLDGLPATISVNYGQSLSYVWDTVECRLLYAWSGGFYDMTNYWGKGSGGNRKGFGYLPKIIGQMKYITSGKLPIQIGNSSKAGKPRFKSMKLIGGSPQFTYTLNGATITEHIVPAEGDTISIHYMIHGAADGIKFIFDNKHKNIVSSDIGKWEDTTVTIPGGHHLHFHLSIKPNVKTKTYKVINQGAVITAAERLGKDGKPVIVPSGLKASATIFNDRPYTFDTVPNAIAGADYIRGFNDDKDGSAKYRVELKKPAIITLLIDERQHSQMTWLNKRSDGLNFKQSGSQVTTNGNWNYVIYEALAKPGTYTFGAQSGGSMYVVAAREIKSK